MEECAVIKQRTRNVQSAQTESHTQLSPRSPPLLCGWRLPVGCSLIFSLPFFQDNHSINPEKPQNTALPNSNVCIRTLFIHPLMYEGDLIYVSIGITCVNHRLITEFTRWLMTFFLHRALEGYAQHVACRVIPNNYHQLTTTWLTHQQVLSNPSLTDVLCLILIRTRGCVAR